MVNRISKALAAVKHVRNKKREIAAAGNLYQQLLAPRVYNIIPAPETEFTSAVQSALAAFAVFCQTRERPTALHANLFQFIRQTAKLTNSDRTHFTDAQFGHALASNFLLETIMNGAPTNRFLSRLAQMIR